MKTIQFTKMQALGNDFVIINVHDLPVPVAELPIRKLGDRNLGIGFDQLLVITPKQQINEFYCDIFNADGSSAEQCGNGLRCIARYVQEKGLCKDNEIHVSTVAGSYRIEVKNYDKITVAMGKPEVKEKVVDYLWNKKPLQLSILSLGNPHAIVHSQVPAEQASAIADAIQHSSHFPYGANVGFVEVKDKHHLRLRTFERGAGETFACGSNACAAAVAGILNGKTESPVNIEFRHGILHVSWDGKNQVELSGPANTVFDGSLQL